MCIKRCVQAHSGRTHRASEETVHAHGNVITLTPPLPNTHKVLTSLASTHKNLTAWQKQNASVQLKKNNNESLRHDQRPRLCRFVLHDLLQTCWVVRVLQWAIYQKLPPPGCMLKCSWAPYWIHGCICWMHCSVSVRGKWILEKMQYKYWFIYHPPKNKCDHPKLVF